MRKNHAAARANRDHRERVCPSPRNRPVARRIPARDDYLPQGQARRPGRFDRPIPRLVQKAIPGLGIREYYRQEAEKIKQRNEPPPVETQWAKGSMEWLAQ